MIVDLLFITVVIGLLIAIYRTKFSADKVESQVKEKVEEQQQKRFEQNINEQSDDQGGKEQMDLKKQLHKEQKKKQKQERKQAHEAWLEQQKKKKQKQYQLQQQKQRKEEEAKRKQEQIIEQMRIDERKRKEEEFQKWKGTFTVEETGQAKLSAEEQAKKLAQKKEQLLKMLKRRKLCELQEISHKMGLTISEVVKEIKILEDDKEVCGVFDERGKYLVIQENEWTAIRNYVQAKGRVKKTDIINECARIIKIPQQIDNDLIELVTAEE